MPVRVGPVGVVAERLEEVVPPEGGPGPAPTALSDYEGRTMKGFRWWSIDDLATTTDTVHPPRLARQVSTVLADGVPPTPVDITE